MALASIIPNHILLCMWVGEQVHQNFMHLCITKFSCYIMYIFCQLQALIAQMMPGNKFFFFFVFFCKGKLCKDIDENGKISYWQGLH